ncbi:putative E3 ubiquitin-protein ligase XBOS34 [Platanthera zijinensis]|uniref:E3 ubiquitin-protein ligase XBOS34 n=1 Tax=Platanthera zijinensis TaxID=2320716 RepID=A0AAP0GCY3_9ASPA
MGANTSKEELLYQQVNYGNVEGIKSLHREGVRLEWIDKEGKTPLILACMRPDLLHVVKALIELGANVNAYRPGRHAGTPLHHAAKRGLEGTVNLLLSHGANPLVMNDDCQTPLDLARAKGHLNVVRAIEARICLYAGWLREIHGPSILEAFAPQWVSRKIWAVVLPCDSRNPTNPKKFELAVYPDLQVSQPRTVLALWKAQIEEPKFNLADPALIIVETAKKTRCKFLSAREGDKNQLLWLYNACRGIYQRQQMLHSNIVPAPPPAAPPLPNSSKTTCSPCPEDLELTFAINASIQTALVEGVPLPHAQQVTSINTTNGCPSSSESLNTDCPGSSNRLSAQVGASRWSDPLTSVGCNGWDVRESAQHTVRPIASTQQLYTSQSETPVVSQLSQEARPAASVPSAPPLSTEMMYGDAIRYPCIDSSPVNLTVTPFESHALSGSETEKDGSGNASGSTCVICLDKPVEGACIPCGHMVGCMSCLKEINEKKGECPVCRTKIHQILRLYAV